VAAHQHDMFYRLRLVGEAVTSEAFADWVVAQAKERHLDGWARARLDGSMDIFYAGQTGPVMGMLIVFTEGHCPFEFDAIEERPMRGDEPLWGGFHYMPAM
jgi:acylphosphatase